MISLNEQFAVAKFARAVAKKTKRKKFMNHTQDGMQVKSSQESWVAQLHLEHYVSVLRRLALVQVFAEFLIA